MSSVSEMLSNYMWHGLRPIVGNLSAEIVLRAQGDYIPGYL